MKGVRSFRFFSDIHVAAEKFCEAGSVQVAGVWWKIFRVVLAAFFAIFGFTTGVISGAFTGLRTQSGILRGAAVGAIFGTMLSTCFFGVCAACWDCEDSSSFWILSWIDSTAILATKLAHDCGTQRSVRRAKRRQNKDLVNEINRIPRINSTDEHQVDSCSICLQELDVAPRLPHCQRLFHADCVERWFSYHRSCPLCRRIVDK